MTAQNFDMAIFDMAIIGRGVVGETLALLLAHSLPQLSVALVPARNGADSIGASPVNAKHTAPDRAQDSADNAYALAPDSVALLARLGVWEGLAQEACAVVGMDISDGAAGDAIFPPFLAFAARSGGREDAPGTALAQIVFASAIKRALSQRLAAATGASSPLQLRAAPLKTIAKGEARHTLVLDDGTQLAARLIVAADGAHSFTRAFFGISAYGFAYDQRVLTGIVRHPHPHHNRARQNFLAGGPFALLPLRDKDGQNRSFVVWSESKSTAKAVLEKDIVAQEDMLLARAGLNLGSLTLTAPLTARALELRLARALIGARLALVGDAGHSVHPLAGQGLNLGLRDAVALGEALEKAVGLGLDIGSNTALVPYQRRRRPANCVAALGFDGLNRLTRAQNPFVITSRRVGFQLVNHMPMVKDFFMRQAGV